MPNMGGCPMHAGRGSLTPSSNPYRLDMQHADRPQATGNDILQMMRPFYWPGGANDHFHKRFFLRLLLFMAIIFLFSSKFVALTAPVFMGRAVTALADHEKEASIRNLAFFSVASFMGFFLQQMVTLCYSYIQKIGIQDLSLSLYKHLHTLSYQWFIDSKGGETVRCLTRGLESMRELTQFSVLTLIPTLLEALGIFLVFCIYFSNLYLSLTLLASLTTYTVLTIVMTNWRQKVRKAQVQRDNEAHSISSDGLANFETVKYYTNENLEVKRYTKAILEHEACQLKVMRSLATINISQEFVKQLGSFGCLLLTALAILRKHRDVGEITAVMVYLFALYRPLFILGTIYSTILRSMAGLADAANLLKLQPIIVDAADAETLVISKTFKGGYAPRNGDEIGHRNDVPPFTPTVPADFIIEFERVYFKYPTAKKPSDSGISCGTSWTLEDLNFKVKRGHSLAIVGPTGSGKTSISRLMCRFFDAAQGVVKVGGIDVRKVTQESLRRNIGVVAQDTVLFHASIRDNIRYAKWDATDDEIYDALKKASLYHRVMEFPQGLDTIVGERGLRLSGGEKQRVSIARCFLKDPPIILLDEATSSLDSKTESQVQEVLFGLSRERTVVAIAHRLSTIIHCDEILFLENGRITERGTHEELLASGGAYAALYNGQTRRPSTCNPTE